MKIYDNELMADRMFAVNKHFEKQKRNLQTEKPSCGCGNPETTKFIDKGKIRFMCIECFVGFLHR